MSTYASALFFFDFSYKNGRSTSVPPAFALLLCRRFSHYRVTFGKLSVMTPSLACHLALRLLALVMSGVILAPKVIHAYNITRNDNVRPFSV